MIAIFKREIMNYLKRPLFWVGVLLVIYGVFNATSPYLTTHYLTTGEKIINDQSNTSVEGEVYEGYIPATPEKHREVWHEKVKIKLTDVFGLTDSEAQNVIEKLESMNLKEAYAYWSRNMTGTGQGIYTRTVRIIRERQKKSTHI